MEVVVGVVDVDELVVELVVELVLEVVVGVVDVLQLVGFTDSPKEKRQKLTLRLSTLLESWKL